VTRLNIVPTALVRTLFPRLSAVGRDHADLITQQSLEFLNGAFTPVALAAMFIFAAGIITLGLGFFIYVLVPPAAIIWALAYYGITLGSPRSATIGMRVMDLEMRTWYGTPAYFVLGAVHAVVFWISVSTLTPLVLLVGFFNERRRLLHDILLGAIIINNEMRANMLRAAKSGG